MATSAHNYGCTLKSWPSEICVVGGSRKTRPTRISSFPGLGWHDASSAEPKADKPLFISILFLFIHLFYLYFLFGLNISHSRFLL